MQGSTTLEAAWGSDVVEMMVTATAGASLLGGKGGSQASAGITFIQSSSRADKRAQIRRYDWPIFC
jgi:hypothetical protein